VASVACQTTQEDRKSDQEEDIARQRCDNMEGVHASHSVSLALSHRRIRRDLTPQIARNVNNHDTQLRSIQLQQFKNMHHHRLTSIRAHLESDLPGVHHRGLTSGKYHQDPFLPSHRMAELELCNSTARCSHSIWLQGTSPLWIVMATGSSVLDFGNQFYSLNDNFFFR